jgi:hypothetical protein
VTGLRGLNAVTGLRGLNAETGLRGGASEIAGGRTAAAGDHSTGTGRDGGEMLAPMSGLLALVGGGEWRDRCSFDRTLLEASGQAEVLVLPTAAAYEHPQRAV